VKQPADGGLGSSSGAGEAAQPNTPFKLSQLDLGSIGMMTRKRPAPAGKKRAAAIASLDDDEDPREEAQVRSPIVDYFNSKSPKALDRVHVLWERAPVSVAILIDDHLNRIVPNEQPPSRRDRQSKHEPIRRSVEASYIR